MDKIIINNKTYDLATNGLDVSDQRLFLSLVTEDIEAVENDLVGVTDIEHYLEDGTKISEYKGYTKLIMLTKAFNQFVSYSDDTHTETRTRIDPETQEEITEEVAVTIHTPQYGTVVQVTLIQPTLEDMVRENAEQITELQEALLER